MERAESLLQQLQAGFPMLEGQGTVVGARRVFIDIPMEQLLDILRYCKKELGFTHLCTITGLDTGDGFEFLYHIADDLGTVLNLKIRTPRENAVIPSVLPIFNGAVFYELELEGLLGVMVDGLPKDRQYPLPDNWPKGQYPLRKDWKPDQISNNP